MYEYVFAQNSAMTLVLKQPHYDEYLIDSHIFVAK